MTLRNRSCPAVSQIWRAEDRGQLQPVGQNEHMAQPHKVPSAFRFQQQPRGCSVCTASRLQGGSEAGKRSGAKRSECLSSTSLLLSTSGRGDGGVRQRVLATPP